MASSKYWQEREDDWRKECQANNVQWQKEIEDVYQTMSDEINDQVLIFYQKYADENGLTLAQAKQYLDQTDIRYYANLAKRYCEDAARDMDAGTWEYSPAKSYFTRQADEEMKRYNTAMKISRLQMLKHQMDLRIANAQRKVCSVVHDALTDRALQTYTRQSGILGKTVLNNLAHVQTIVKASFHGANFSQRIWGTQQDKLKKVLTKSLQDCLILGKGAAPFARELKKQTGKSIRQAQTLMSTELARVQVQAALDSMQVSGFDEFQVVSSPDCCDDCKAINGHHYPIPKLATGENAPPMHPNCRCSIAPYEARDEAGDDGFDEAAFDEWSDTYDEHGLSWEDWKKRRDNPEQGKDEEREKSRDKDREYAVNWEKVKSPEYKQKFIKLVNDEELADRLYQKAIDILEHRSGTDFEDIHLIDSKSKKVVASQTKTETVSVSDEADRHQHVIYNDEMKRAIKKAEPKQLISIHNHPENYPPSGSDFASAFRNGYGYGVIACHNGDIYGYKVGKKEFSARAFDLAVEKNRLIFGSIDKAYQVTLDEFSENYGLRWIKL